MPPRDRRYDQRKDKRIGETLSSFFPSFILSQKGEANKKEKGKKHARSTSKHAILIPKGTAAEILRHRPWNNLAINIDSTATGIMELGYFLEDSFG